MKLYELINFDPEYSKSNSRSYISKIRSKTDAKVAGRPGSFGTAFNTGSGKRLNQITKVGRGGTLSGEKNAFNPDEDGYLSYLKAIQDIKHSGNNNPYFPRIHDLKTIRDKHTEHISYRVNMEKLVPFKSDKIIYNDDLMRSLYSDMFNDQYDENPLSIPSNIEIACYSNTWNIKDPDLLEVIKLIQEIKARSDRDLDNGFGIDLHEGNMMWRITGTRPQLVITDPLA